MHARTLMLVLLALICLATAQPPVFRIGGTLSQCGRGSDISTGMKTALEFYANYTNTFGGVNINGTSHQLEIIIYNDAFDSQLVALLYERLVLVDQVHALLSPLTEATNAFITAQKYGIPLMNIGDLTYACPNRSSRANGIINATYLILRRYYTLGAKNGTWGGWVFSSVPNPLAFIDRCFDIMIEHGLQTLTSAWPEDIDILSFDLININAVQRYKLSIIPPVLYLPTDESTIKDSVSRLKKQDADFFSGGMLVGSNQLALIKEMRLQQYNPQAIIFWSGTLFESFRKEAGWQAYRIFGASFWDSSLNFTDAQFGSSIEFAAEYQRSLGVEPDATSVLAIFGAMSLKLAVEKAGVLDPNSIRVGLANYSFPLQQTQGEYYCFQVDDSGALHPVSLNAPKPTPVLWPTYVPPPPDFLSSSNSSRGKWIGLGVGLGGGLLLLIIIGVTVIYIWKVKYSQSDANGGEW